MHAIRRAIAAALALFAGAATASDPPCPDPRTHSQAALAYLDHLQDEIDELRAGGHGPLRIAYLHHLGDTHRDDLLRLAADEDLLFTAYRVGTADLTQTGHEVARSQPDWVLVSSDPVRHGAILTALSQAGVPSALVIPFHRAAAAACPNK